MVLMESDFCALMGGPKFFDSRFPMSLRAGIKFVSGFLHWVSGYWSKRGSQCAALRLFT